MIIHESEKSIDHDSIDFSKIKGHCKIELTDVNTGKVEVEEHDNMVTKALSYFYKQGGITNPTAFNGNLMSNALYYMLGGMMCLDTALTEDDEIVRVPSGVKMTANGARDVVNTGNPNELGSYNENESGWQQDGSYKMVWDYNTSQGNGNIACVCLTSEYWGRAGIGNPSDTRTSFTNISINSYNAINSKATGNNRVAIGLVGNVLTMMDSTIQGKESITISKYKFPFSKVDIRNTMESELISETSLALPNDLKNLGGLKPVVAVYYKEGYAYILIGDQPNASYPSLNTTFYIIVYDLQYDELVDVMDITVPITGANVQCVGISNRWIIISHYAIERLNPSNVIDLTDNMGIVHESFGGWFARLSAIDSKTFYGFMSGANVGFVIDVDNETIHPTNNQEEFYTIGEPSPLLRLTPSGNMSVYRDPRYIATIFNLGSPVTKTADKTMKVTYVISFT